MSRTTTTHKYQNHRACPIPTKVELNNPNVTPDSSLVPVAKPPLHLHLCYRVSSPSFPNTTMPPETPSFYSIATTIELAPNSSNEIIFPHMGQWYLSAQKCISIELSGGKKNYVTEIWFHFIYSIKWNHIFFIFFMQKKNCTIESYFRCIFFFHTPTYTMEVWFYFAWLTMEPWFHKKDIFEIKK